MSMYPTMTVITDTMTAKGMFLQERGREAHNEQAVPLLFFIALLQIAAGTG